MNKEQAIKANPFGEWLASYVNGKNEKICCVFNTQQECIQWINFSKEIAKPFSDNTVKFK